MQNLAIQNGEARRFGLDLLRAGAVLCVVLAHDVGCPDNVPYWIIRFSRLAILAVELFFVLSGFLIGGLLIDQIRAGRFRTSRDLLHFWARRWMRTLPLYYLFLVIHHICVAGDLRLIPQRLNFIFFLQNFAWESPPFFGVAWTLSIEEHFYLLFPLLCFLLARSSTKPLPRLIWSAAVFLLVPLVLKGLSPPGLKWSDFDGKLRQVVFLRLDSLMYGVGAAVLYKYFPVVWERVRRQSAIPFCLIAGLSFYSYFDFPGLVASPWLQVFFFPFTSLCFALLLPCFHAMKRPALRPFAAAVTYVSTTSYSLYLSHALVILLATRGFLATEGGRAWFGQPLFFTPFLFALSVLLASLTYYLWEAPFLRLRDRLVPTGRAGILVLIPCKI